MDVPPRAIKAAKVSAVVLVALVVLLGILVATGVLAAPTVGSIDKGWGEVTDNTTEIETQVTVDNPNPIGIPGVITVEYTASLNDVVLTQNKRSGIGLSPGTNTLRLTSEMENDRIADWWVTHVNNGEQSTLRIDPKVSGPGFSQSLSTQSSTIETDLLSSFGNEGQESLTLDGESFLLLRDQQAAWGEATNETTPLSFTTTLENVHDYPVTLDGVAYEVSMNDVTLGSGQTTDGVDIAPGETDTLTVDASLTTAAFAEWWPTHVRGNETSRMDVQLYGIVEQDGERRRVPLKLYQQRLEFDTDLLGDGGTSVQSLPTQRDGITVPTIGETDRQWGELTEESAEVVTTVELNRTVDFSKLREVTTLQVDSRTSINDVSVLNDTTTQSLPEAGQPLTVSGEMDNQQFAEWWPKHVNGGESSTVVTEAGVLVDVGITKFQRSLAAERSQFETDILSSIGQDGPQTVTVANETLAVFEDQQAEWGQADAETTPFTLSTTVDNRHDRPIAFDGVEYSVTMNDVTVASGTSEETLALDPGETDQLDVTVPLSTPKLSEWWGSHLQSGENSTVSVQLYGLVERDGSTERIPIALARDRFQLTTDLLGGDSSTVESLSVDRIEVGTPTLNGTTQQWGAVTDDTTEILTDVLVENPNTDPDINEFVRLTMKSETVVNGELFGSGERSGVTLAPGTNDIELTTVLDNGVVPEWWARHLNNGERSVMNTTTTTTADVGFTTIAVPTNDRNSTFETDLLAGFNTDEPQPIEDEGRTYLVAESTSAEWGEATPQVAPMNVRTDLRNEQPVPITIVEINYTVSLNDVTLADGIHAENTVIQPEESETVAVTMPLDNTKMDAWWVTHVRNDESSLLDVDAMVTINVAGETRTVPLEALSKNETFETDILNE